MSRQPQGFVPNPSVTWTWTTRTSGTLMKLVRDVSHKRETMLLHVLTWLKPRAGQTAESHRWRSDWWGHHYSRCLSFQMSVPSVSHLSHSSLRLSPCWQVRSWHRTTWAMAAWRCLSGVTVKAVGISCRSACASCTCLTATFVCVSVTAPPFHVAKSTFKRAAQSQTSGFLNVPCINLQCRYIRQKVVLYSVESISLNTCEYSHSLFLCVGSMALFSSLFISMRLTSPTLVEPCIQNRSISTLL